MKYSYRLKFDVEGEPPEILIVNEEGTAIAEVFEEATTETGVFSWNEYDWKVGKCTLKILDFLNKTSRRSRECEVLKNALLKGLRMREHYEMANIIEDLYEKEMKKE